MPCGFLIDDVAYSSWSLRGWLALTGFGLSARLRRVPFVTGGKDEALAGLPPAATVPVLRLPDGTVVGQLARSRRDAGRAPPVAGHWPRNPAQRATARWLAAEMRSGFQVLRSACSMNLTRRYNGSAAPEPVRRDLERIEALWAHARSFGDGRWLFGN